MPRNPGKCIKVEFVNQLIKEKGLTRKKHFDRSRDKTLQRALKGMPISDDSLHYIAQTLGVDVSEIIHPEDADHSSLKQDLVRCVRTDSLKGIPSEFFGERAIEDPDLLLTPVIDARFELDDPTEDQAELAARIVESIEQLTRPMKPSALIRAKGQLNTSIKKLASMDVTLYIGSFIERRNAWPFIDADQSEKAWAVDAHHLLLVFAPDLKAGSLKRPATAGISLEQRREDVDWLNGQIQRAAQGELDDEELRYLDRLREEARHIFVNYKI